MWLRPGGDNLVGRVDPAECEGDRVERMVVAGLLIVGACIADYVDAVVALASVAGSGLDADIGRYAAQYEVADTQAGQDRLKLSCRTSSVVTFR